MITEAKTSSSSLPEPEAPSAATGRTFRVPKIFSTLLKRGPGAFLRHGIYSYYYHSERRRKEQRIRHPAKQQAKVQLWGRQFELHPSLAGINEELQVFGVHEPLATETYQRFLKEDDHVIDIGANIGYYLFAAAKVLGNKGKFLAFEPLPSNFSVLERNIQSLDIPKDRIQMWPWAIGDTNGTAKFYESKMPNWGGLFQDDKLQQTGTITVEVRRLDEVIESVDGFKPSVLRMDVEGAELLVLAGAKKLIRTYKPMLFIEFHTFAIGMNGVETALDEFQSIGYREGVLIERIWDVPWIASWAGRQRCAYDSLGNLRRRISGNPSDFPVFTLILKCPAA